MPNLEFESRYAGKIIAGIDEVGRGCLAGPIVACACILNLDNIIPDIDDSKKLTAKKRELLYEMLIRNVTYNIAIIGPAIIDKIGINPANRLAMEQAFNELPVKAEVALIDGAQIVPEIDALKLTIIKGDQLSMSIAAASIIAKVTRDRLMREIGAIHPEYGFECHAGYGTKKHMEAIAKYGATIHHRMSFAPFSLRPAIGC